MSVYFDPKRLIMAGEFDPISRVLGGLEKFEAMMNKRMDSQDDQLSKINIKVTGLANDFSIDHAYMETHVRPTIEKLNRDKVWQSGWKAAWATRIGTGAAGGALVLYAPKLAAFLGHIFP